MTTQKELLPDFHQAKILAEAYEQIILEDLGLELDRYGDCKGPCPVHCGDNPRAFSYSSKRHTWQCFTKKCHLEYKTSILGLIRGIKDCTWDEVIDYVENITGKKIKEISQADIERKSFIKQHTPTQEDYKPTIYPESILSSATKDYSYFLGRGFSEEILKEYDNFVCLDKTKALSNRSCFPIRDLYGRIVGFTGRTLVGEEPKWKTIASKYTLQNNLFGLHKAKYHISNRTIILVEGPLDHIKLAQYGILHSVSSCGIQLYQEQINALLNVGIQKIKIAYDPDDAGKVATKRIADSLRLMFDIESLSFNLPCDPGEMTQEQIMEHFVDD